MLGNDMSNPYEVFPWTDSYATGIPQIDQQHQTLVQLLNTLSSRLTYRIDMPSSRILFKELVEYADYHFQTEENIWHQFFANDPWESDHKKSHIDFISIVNKLKDEENSLPLEAVLKDIMSFLVLWLTSHILESDKRMAKVVLAIQSGLSLEQAKLQASQEMLLEK